MAVFCSSLLLFFPGHVAEVFSEWFWGGSSCPLLLLVFIIIIIIIISKYYVACSAACCMLNIKNADTLQTIYSAYFHTTVKYRIALLGTLLTAEMYSLQRSKLLELWLTQNTKIHVDACFYDWKLFPLPCEYVFLLIDFFINKQENFQANESVHNIKNRE